MNCFSIPFLSGNFPLKKSLYSTQYSIRFSKTSLDYIFFFIFIKQRKWPSITENEVISTYLATVSFFIVTPGSKKSVLKEPSWSKDHMEKKRLLKVRGVILFVSSPRLACSPRLGGGADGQARQADRETRRAFEARRGELGTVSHHEERSAAELIRNFSAWF